MAEPDFEEHNGLFLKLTLLRSNSYENSFNFLILSGSALNVNRNEAHNQHSILFKKKSLFECQQSLHHLINYRKPVKMFQRNLKQDY